MIYPKFIKKGDMIGICAPSAGVSKYINMYLDGIKIIEDHGFKYKETKHVRVNNKRSANAKIRANELNSIYDDKNVGLVFCATGGDFMFEILPYINYEALLKNPKWICGLSDPTNILYTLTTKYDIATIYSNNVNGQIINEGVAQEYFYNLIQGNMLIEKSQKKHEKAGSFNKVFSEETNWNCLNEVNVKGRIIGGCFEVIEKLIGTKFDGTNSFINKYKDDGIIWYFDIFSYSPYQVYLSLLQFKYAGYFKNTKAVLVGRVCFSHNEDNPDLTYEKVFKKVFGKIPVILEADVGHVRPSLPIINGAIATLKYKNHKGSIKFELK